MKKLLLFTLLLVEINMQAQDPAFSQLNMNQLYLNPAFAGISKNARGGLNYRNQWTGIARKLNTYNLWGDIYISRRKSTKRENGLGKGLGKGLGMILLQDVSGEGFLKTTSFGVLPSIECCILKKILKVRIGANLTVTNKRIDWDKLLFSDQLDGMNGQIYPTAAVPGSREGKTFFDPAAGVIISYTAPNNKITINVGYSVNHLTKPNEGLSGSADRYLPQKHTIHGTIDFKINDMRDNNKSNHFSISPNLLFEQQANFTTTNLGLYMGRKQVIGGLFFRNRKIMDFKDADAVIFFLGVNQKIGETNNILKIGLSYDMTINNLGTNTRGSYELSISWEFNAKKQGTSDCHPPKIDPCQCPNPFFY